ncbi:ABC transporter permease [Actinokineospora sp. NBRC 105648]|uniref:ABC transporter permease n=1 Tax=Actinokineospora sp. NBRC 105648 TaxID=3032206 RepID=UPI0024A2115F|nr:ABC transporter permease [Actinokineospora sp. NBRC 105648]GLZ41825.1 transport permease protein [Actinokineospora sp. NBRC 105648]
MSAPGPDRAEWTGSSLPTQVWVLTTRSLRAAFGDYRLVFFGLLQPVVLLLLFTQVFAGVGALPGVAPYAGYVNYLMPATLVNIAVITAMGAGAGLMAETYTGVVDRLRSLPIRPVSVLLARTFADSARLTVQLAAITGAGVLFLGFQPRGGVLGLAAAVLLATVVGWGLSWVFVAIATWRRNVELMQAVSFVAMFPLMFSSSAYMPLASMPGWMRAVATVNPITYAIDATRALALGRPPGAAPAWALLLALGAALGAGAVAVRNFRRAT